jgi:hypothetical protein
MEPGWLEPALHVASFFGILILAVPVWSLNWRKKRLQQIREATDATDGASDLRAKIRAILKDRRERDVADWRRADEICLWLGYALLLGSAAIRALAALLA